MAWRDEKIAELAKQLAYSPAEKRGEQLAAAYALFPQIDGQREYPWEFILFRLTGYRPKEAVEHPVAGGDLQADLAKFIEFLSDTLSIKACDAGEPVLSLEQVAGQFTVLTKTIQRWRRQGLLRKVRIWRRSQAPGISGIGGTAVLEHQ